MTDNFLGWDIDSLTSAPPENDSQPNIVAFTKPIPPAPPTQQEPYPWTDSEDEAFRMGAFKRTWVGLSRREWNESPYHIGLKMYASCGYRWYAHLFQHPGNDSICWNCYMVENRKDEVDKYWRLWDADHGGTKKHGETAPVILVKLGNKKE